MVGKEELKLSKEKNVKTCSDALLIHPPGAVQYISFNVSLFHILAEPESS